MQCGWHSLGHGVEKKTRLMGENGQTYVYIFVEIVLWQVVITAVRGAGLRVLVRELGEFVLHYAFNITSEIVLSKLCESVAMYLWLQHHF